MIKSGSILVAEPFMADSHFKRAVVLLCEHEQGGTLGFILNKPVNMEVESLLADFPEFSADVFYGGPVQTNTLHYVHRKGDLLEGSQEVMPGIYWGGDFERLKFLIRTGLITNDDIRFFVGYSGWTAGQLEEEMKLGSWVLSFMDANYLFKEDAATLWRKALEDKGDTFGVIGQMGDDNQLN